MVFHVLPPHLKQVCSETALNLNIDQSTRRDVFACSASLYTNKNVF